WNPDFSGARGLQVRPPPGGPIAKAIVWPGSPRWRRQPGLSRARLVRPTPSCPFRIVSVPPLPQYAPWDLYVRAGLAETAGLSLADPKSPTLLPHEGGPQPFYLSITQPMRRIPSPSVPILPIRTPVGCQSHSRHSAQVTQLVLVSRSPAAAIRSVF